MRSTPCASSSSSGASHGRPRDALRLWRGQPFDDIADQPFAGAEVRRLEGLWLRALELAIDAALAAGGTPRSSASSTSSSPRTRCVSGPRAAHARAVPVRAPGGRARGVPRRPRRAGAGGGRRAGSGVAPPPRGDPRPGPVAGLPPARSALRPPPARRPRPARRGCRRCVARRRCGRCGRPGRGRLRLPAVCCGRQRRRHHRPREGRRGRLDRARRWPGPDRGGFRGHHGAHPQQQDPRAHRRHLATDRRDGGGRGLAGRSRRHVRRPMGHAELRRRKPGLAAPVRRGAGGRDQPLRR